MTPPALWLTFFGIPALIAADGKETPLALRYRKGVALLAWLATRSARPQHRRAVAELFWPDLDTSAAHANLRLVLNDLTKRLSVLGLAEIVEVQPEWLTFRGGAHVVTDERWMADTALRALFPAHLAERAERVWCDLDGFDKEGDFGEWLHAYRLWLAERWSASQPTPEKAAIGLAPTQRPTGPEWRHLAILRVAFADDGLDERAAHGERRARFEQLAGALRIHGATPAGMDAEGATFVFGLYARSGGFCRLALRAALTCLEEMPTARIGLISGHLFVSHDENAFQGRRMLDAAHLARLADLGEIALDDSFAELPGRLARRSTHHRLRPNAAATHVWFHASENLRHILAAPLFPETPFFGREADVGHLHALLAAHSPVILIGPPGVGKTRLALEFARSPDAPRAIWLFCRAETAQSPWACLIELLAREDLIDFPERETQAVRHLLSQRHVGIEQRGGLLAALARLFADGLAIVDDAQWMDTSTARLFDELMRIARHPWLLTRRPQAGGWLPDGAMRHELGPLDDAAGERLLASLDRTARPAAETKNMLARARGLPLLLIAEANHDPAQRSDALSAWCNLPGVRSDTLGAAALLGQQFRRDDLIDLTGAEATEAMLTTAADEGLVFAYHRDWWGFVHPLLRDECHARLDRDTELRFAMQAAERFLARNETARAAELFETAGATERAALTWLDAAQSALLAEDASAACALFERLARLGYPPGMSGDWARINHAKALIVRDGYGVSAIETLCQPVALAHRDATNDASRELRFAAEAIVYLWSGGPTKRFGLLQADRLIDLAETPEQRYAATWARANTSFFTGDFATARCDFETLLASDLDHAGRTRYFPSDPFAFLATNHAWLLWFIGEAGWREETERHVARTLAEPTHQAECIARVFAAAIYLAQGEWDTMAAHAVRALEIAQTEAFAFWEAYAMMMVLIVRAHQGVPPDSAACDAIEAAVTRGYPAGVNTARWLLAEAWGAARCWPEALALTERTLASADQSEHLYCLPDIQRLHAFALAGLGETTAAQTAMRTARDLAETRGLHGWLARWPTDAIDLAAAAQS